jgi:hypothetical protein
MIVMKSASQGRGDVTIELGALMDGHISKTAGNKWGR